MQYDWRRQHPYTNLCPHTGLTIPECSCLTCTERQIARANVSTREAASAGARRIEYGLRAGAAVNTGGAANTIFAEALCINN